MFDDSNVKQIAKQGAKHCTVDPFGSIDGRINLFISVKSSFWTRKC